MQQLRIALLCALFAATPCGAQDTSAVTSFLGKWRSSAELTLRDMATRPGVTEQQKRRYEGLQQTRGALVLIVSRRLLISYFAREEGEAVSQSYAIVESGPGFVVFETPKLVGAGVDRTRLESDGRCIFIQAEDVRYREYFCPAG